MPSVVDRRVIARESNILRVDFSREPQPPAPRFPGASGLRLSVTEREGAKAPTATGTSAAGYDWGLMTLQLGGGKPEAGSNSEPQFLLHHRRVLASGGALWAKSFFSAQKTAKTLRADLELSPPTSSRYPKMRR